MKTRNLILTFLLLLVLPNLYSQEFAPEGATWYYSKHYAFSGEIGYYRIEASGDTLLNGKNCRILNHNGSPSCNFYSDAYYVYEEDSVVWFYVPQIDSFQILYDLRAQKDSSWTVIYSSDPLNELDTVNVIVDSVSYMNINGMKLKRLHLHHVALHGNQGGVNYGKTLIEKIGDLYYLISFYSLDIICDGDFSAGLRCYEDPEIGFYSTGIADSCTYTNDYDAVEPAGEENDITLLPNPATDRIVIESDSYQLLFLTLYDLSGRNLGNYSVYQQAEIDLSHLQPGIYLIRFRDKAQLNFVEMIQKL